MWNKIVISKKTKTKIKMFFAIGVCLVMVADGRGVRAESLAARLAGRILLAVEDKGQAWYVNPDDHWRYFLGRPQDAWQLMRELGIGITNNDLEKIPVSLNFSTGADSDNDGLADILEAALGTDSQRSDTDGDGFSDWAELANGYNPLGAGILPIDLRFSRRQAGKIFLAVQRHGEAWYVNPIDGRRYFLGRPQDAFRLMRSLGLGIADNDLKEIPARTNELNARAMAKDIWQRINNEREKNSLAPLLWNNEVAVVAAAYSRYLAAENEAFTGFGVSCDYPLIHHQASGFGPAASDRLRQKNIYYFSRVGENIALVSAADLKIRFSAGDPIQAKINACTSERKELDNSFRRRLAAASGTPEKLAVIAAEIKKRSDAFANISQATVAAVNWHSGSEIDADIVAGWLASPGHRENILDPNFNETGIGVAVVNTYIIAVQVFITRASCGFQGGSCCEEAGYLPYCFIPLKCVESQCVED